MKTQLRFAPSVLLGLFLVIFTLLSPVVSRALTMSAAEDAAKTTGFDEVSKRKPKDPFYGSKRKDAKEWTTFEAYPKGAEASQIAITCNQCKDRKMTEAFQVTCYDQVSKVAAALGVDLPGGVVRAFEKGVADKTWELKVNKAASVRLKKTGLKCDMGPGGSGYRFDFFF